MALQRGLKPGFLGGQRLSQSLHAHQLIDEGKPRTGVFGQRHCEDACQLHADALVGAEPALQERCLSGDDGSPHGRRIHRPCRLREDRSRRIVCVLPCGSGVQSLDQPGFVRHRKEGRDVARHVLWCAGKCREPVGELPDFRQCARCRRRHDVGDAGCFGQQTFDCLPGGGEFDLQPLPVGWLQIEFTNGLERMALRRPRFFQGLQERPDCLRSKVSVCPPRLLKPLQGNGRRPSAGVEEADDRG